MGTLFVYQVITNNVKAMKKILFAIMILMMAISTQANAQESNIKQEKAQLELNKKALRAEQKRLQQQIDSVQYAEATQALNDTAFTLEASRVVFKLGQRAFVHSTTNFVKVAKGHATVQVAFNVPVAGPNGMGGVTVDGIVSNYKKTTDKRGNTMVSFSVQGIGISAQLFIDMAKGSNEASVTISPNFNSNTLTLEGVILKPEDSFVVKGSTL